MRMRDFRHEGEFLTAGWTLHNGTEVRGRVAEFAGFTLDSDRDAMVSAINNAQELLAACTRALGFVDSMPDNDNVGLADCLRAAIAKAEGGAS